MVRIAEFEGETEMGVSYKIIRDKFSRPYEDYLCNCQHKRWCQTFPCCLAQVVCYKGVEGDRYAFSEPVELACLRGHQLHVEDPESYYREAVEAIKCAISDLFSDVRLHCALEIARFTVDNAVRPANDRVKKYAFNRIEIQISPRILEESVGSCTPDPNLWWDPLQGIAPRMQWLDRAS